MWLDQGDPVESSKTARQFDPNRDAMHQRISALLMAFGTDREFTAADVYKKATEMTVALYGKPAARFQDLLDAFSRDGHINAKSIGRQLNRELDRISNGHHIELTVKDAHHGTSYRLMGPPTEHANLQEAEKEQPPTENEPF
jgi:hypothetical protein